MPEAGAAEAAGASLRFLTFWIDERLYAFPTEQVSEVIHVPPVARVPQAPASLMGVANLRGSVLPVASGRGLLGRGAKPATASNRAIVLDGGAPVAVVVDAVVGLVSVDADKVETRPAEVATESGEVLTGAFRVEGATEVAKVLDLRALLSTAFVPRQRPERRTLAQDAVVGVADVGTDDAQKLVTFDVAGQEYGLALDAVQEIIPAPERSAFVPRAEAVVLGVMGYRDSLLPLLSLRALLGLPLASGVSERDKVVVTHVGPTLVGLVADGMRTLVAAKPELVEPTPPMLAARTGGEAKVQAIYRGDGGRRLVSILSPDQLFREDVMQRLGEAETATIAAPQGVADEQVQFLVFRLGDDEFGLPIETVDEVATVPAQITRVPKTPKFLEGVINLRGEVLPVVDQRRRFDMAAAPHPEARRLIVLRTERHRAGVIVDSVSEVLRCGVDQIEEAPDLTGEATRLVRGVVNLETAGRIVLLLDPAELLTRAERGLLDAFQPEAR
jgi:purine-binding chemotaxis protein CheW